MKKSFRIRYIPVIMISILLIVLCFHYLYPYFKKDNREIEFSQSTNFLLVEPGELIYDTSFLSHFIHKTTLFSFREETKYGNFVESIGRLGIDSPINFRDNIWSFYQTTDKIAFEKIKDVREKLKEMKKYKKMEKYKNKMPLGNILDQTLKVWPILLAIILLSIISVDRGPK